MKMTRLTVRRLALTATDILELEGNYLAVPNNRGTGMRDAFDSLADLLEKYEKWVLVYSPKKCSLQVIFREFLHFCQRNHKNFAIIESAANEDPSPGTAYITLNDTDLAIVIASSNVRGYSIGQEVGLLSLDDSPLKKFVGITVLTTDLKDTDFPASSYCLHPQLQTSNSHAQIIRRSSL